MLNVFYEGEVRSMAVKALEHGDTVRFNKLMELLEKNETSK